MINRQITDILLSSFRQTAHKSLAAKLSRQELGTIRADLPNTEAPLIAGFGEASPSPLKA